MEDDGRVAVCRMRSFARWIFAFGTFGLVSTSVCGITISSGSLVRVLVVARAEQRVLLIHVLVHRVSLSAHSERAPRQRLRLFIL